MGDGGVVVAVEAGVHFGHVVALGAVGNGHVRPRLDVLGLDKEVVHHGDTGIGRRHGVAVARNDTIGNDQDQLVRVGVVGGGDRVQRRA